MIPLLPQTEAQRSFFRGQMSVVIALTIGIILGLLL